MLIDYTHLLNILQKTLNLVDYRLVDHGERVAYILLKMLQLEGGYTREELTELCILSVLHDIGAFKTEPIDSLASVGELARFDIGNVAAHSAYGYLFVRNFLGFGGMGDLLLYHHARWDRLTGGETAHNGLAQRLSVAERFDLLHSMDRGLPPEGCFRETRGNVFSSEAVDLLIQAERRDGITRALETSDYLEELYQMFGKVPIPPAEQVNFLRMLVFTIDFRSTSTVAHTVYVVAFSMGLASLMGVSAQDSADLFMGSMLHDLGKIATPAHILEKPGRLTGAEYDVMKDHIIVTRDILKNCVSDKILQIAVRHHEKLDGTGYPEGLRAEELTKCQRIVAVADLASALLGKRSYKEPMPQQKVRELLEQEALDGKLCPEAVGVMLGSFDLLLRRADNYCRPLLEKYRKIQEDYPRYVGLVEGVA